MPSPSRATSATPARDIDYTAIDFERVRRLIRGRAGISLPPHKQEMVYSRLARRVRALGLHSFQRYLDTLERGGNAEWDHFTSSLTTNLTSFFRESHHFEALSAKLRPWAAAQRPIRLWCAGCSTGEEAYSAAMTLVETFGTWLPPATLVASDIDTAALKKAQRGRYPLEHLRRLDARRIEKFFDCAPSARPEYAEVRPQLRNLVRFRRINLLDAWPMRASFNAIFCRNVLIYFDRATRRRVVERFRRVLHPDGLLFLGHADSLYDSADLFRPLGGTTYAPRAATAADRHSGGLPAALTNRTASIR